MATSLNVDVNKCADRLKARFPQFEEYKLEVELPASKGQYIAMKIENENPVLFSIYVIISHNDGIMLRFGELILYCQHTAVDAGMLEKIDMILSDKIIALVNYENAIYEKRGIPKISTYFIMGDSGELDEERKRLHSVLSDLRRNVTGLKRFFNKYRGITVLLNWSGTMFEKFER